MWASGNYAAVVTDLVGELGPILVRAAGIKSGDRVSVTGPLRRMVEIWRGDLGWPAAIRSGSIELQGPERLRRAVPKWFPPSQFSQVPRSTVDITALAG